MNVTRRKVLLALGVNAVGVGAVSRYDRGAKSEPDVRRERTMQGGPLVEIPFDTTESIDQFTSIDTAENVVITRSDAADESPALEVTFREGGHYGTSLHYLFAEAGYDQPEAIHAQYALKFGEGFRIGSTGGGKLPGPAGRYGRAGWGGRESDGTNGWSARMFFRPSGDPERPVELASYVYYAGMEGRYGDLMSWDESDAGQLERGSWYQIDNYVELNTPGVGDGVVRGWVDGNLAFERADFRFRDVSELLVEEYWFDCYWGGSGDSPRHNHLYVDDLALFDGELVTSDSTATGGE